MAEFRDRDGDGAVPFGRRYLPREHTRGRQGVDEASCASSRGSNTRECEPNEHRADCWGGHWAVQERGEWACGTAACAGLSCPTERAHFHQGWFSVLLRPSYMPHLESLTDMSLLGPAGHHHRHRRRGGQKPQCEQRERVFACDVLSACIQVDRGQTSAHEMMPSKTCCAHDR